MKKAVQISGVGLFISLLFCVYMVNGGLFWSLVPVWMFLAGMVIYIAMTWMKPIRDKKKVKGLILFLLAVVIGIILGIL